MSHFNTLVLVFKTHRIPEWPGLEWPGLFQMVSRLFRAAVFIANPPIFILKKSSPIWKSTIIKAFHHQTTDYNGLWELQFEEHLSVKHCSAIEPGLCKGVKGGYTVQGKQRKL